MSKEVLPLFGQPQRHAPSTEEDTLRRVGAWQLSPSGRTAVKAPREPTTGPSAAGAPAETRDFFAAKEVIDASNQALATAGSPLRLVAEDSVGLPPQLAGTGLLPVAPVLTLSSREQRGDTLLSGHECTGVAQVLAGGKDSWRAVFRSPDGREATALMKVDVNLEARSDTSGPLIRLLTTAQEGPAQLAARLADGRVRYDFRYHHGDLQVHVNAVERDDSSESDDTKTKRFEDLDSDELSDSEELSDTAQVVAEQLTAGHMPEAAAKALALFMRAKCDDSPAFQQELVDRLPDDFARRSPDALPGILNAALESLHTELNAPNPAYEHADPLRLAAVGNRFGVNDAAAPGPGEAFATLSSRDATPQERQTGAGDLWQHHLATVVAVDGDVRITLENYTRHNTLKPNAMWYFAMYSPGGPNSFHRVWGARTMAALTLVLRKDR